MKHWSVQVCDERGVVVTIETQALSGRPITLEDEDTIQLAASHLLSFIGRVYTIEKPEECTADEKDATP